jgi:serine O-acetyltransferase
MKLLALVRVFRDLLREDFAVNPNADARFTLAVWRMEHVLHRQPGVVPLVLRRVSRMLNRVWLRAYIGAVIPPQVSPGPGLRLAHCARGLVLHHTVKIGANVTIFHQVTVGVRDKRPIEEQPELAAEIHDGVYLGAGAKILGPVVLGANSAVGANAVVLTDVPAGAAAIGVPARVKLAADR